MQRFPPSALYSRIKTIGICPNSITIRSSSSIDDGEKTIAKDDENGRRRKKDEDCDWAICRMEWMDTRRGVENTKSRQASLGKREEDDVMIF
jgi:hypothetical protein